MKLKVALPGLIVLSLAILACSFSGLLEKPKVNSYPPFETKAYTEQKSDDAKMRYVIADMQLGGKQVEEYYRQYASQDPTIQQAITNYDNNVRIVNIYQFNRIYIENQGWLIIYGGTDNIIIQAEDVVLTEDIKGTANFDVRVRYMLADMQLGDVVDYYRQFTDDLAVATAVKWWDIGVRVENIQQFERKIVGYAGWKIVYAGTENATDGMDVKLVDQDEAQIRYILADIQLGNVFDYYNARTNEPAISDAVSCWEQSARIENINDFERKTVGDLGWKVTYKGTNIQIYGMEVKISGSCQMPPEKLSCDDPTKFTPEEVANCHASYDGWYTTCNATDPTLQDSFCGPYGGAPESCNNVESLLRNNTLQIAPNTYCIKSDDPTFKGDCRVQITYTLTSCIATDYGFDGKPFVQKSWDIVK